VGAVVTTTRLLAVNGLEPPDEDPLAEDEPKAEPDDDADAWELDWDGPCGLDQIDRARR
jgi:hypothetical protein